MQTISLLQPDDWHLHLRDAQALRYVVGATARQFARAVVMPNLKPPVVRTEQALAYRQRILDALRQAYEAGEIDEQQAKFNPLMTLYMTERTTAADIREAHASGKIIGVKLYPAGATTNSDAGVSDVRKVAHVLEAMQEVDLPLLVHGEVTDSAIDVFDREAVFIDTVLEPLRRSFPGLRVVFEHITTEQAAHYVRDASGAVPGSHAAQGQAGIAATITAHHLLYNRTSMFTGGLRPHLYCLPVLKRERHRAALLQAATSGNPRFFLGTDSAPHATRLKEHAAVCAGCYTAPHALELYATAFASVDALAALEGFASLFGPQFYRLPVNSQKVTLAAMSWEVPQQLPFPGDGITPLAAGETLAWKLLAHPQ
jgi:dihydroorotase